MLGMAEICRSRCGNADAGDEGGELLGFPGCPAYVVASATLANWLVEAVVPHGDCKVESLQLAPGGQGLDAVE